VDALRLALDTERQAVQAIDRAYWEPLRRELEAFRKAERLS
jgi:Arc/MetJ family transcription regulator